MRVRLIMMTLAVVALAGCGGGGSKKEASQTTPATTMSVPATTTPTETQTSAAPASTGGSGVTPLGSTLKLGEPAVIAYSDTSKHNKSTIQVTPQKIEQGTIDDFKNIDLDANQKTATPFYVKVDVKNVGKGDLTGSDPGSYIDGIDDRGQEQSGVIFFGTFERCPAETPKSLKPGESYTSCQTFLIPKGGSLEGMRWIAFDPKTSKSNIDWK